MKQKWNIPKNNAIFVCVFILEMLILFHKIFQ